MTNLTESFHNGTMQDCSLRGWEPYMKLSLVPIIAVVGIVGNTLSFIVLCSPVFSRKTYSHYLQSLAIFDTLTLLLIAIRECDEICRNLGNYGSCIYPWLLRNTISCKLWELFQHVVYLMSSWLVVCFTIDRCVAVCLPLLHRHFTETKSKVALGVVAILATLTQSFRLWYIEHVPGRSQPCHVPLEYVDIDNDLRAPTNETAERRLTYMMLDTFAFAFGFRFLLPCLIIVVCNGYIIFHIVRVRRGLPLRERRKSRYANMAVTTLFVVCIMFVLCLLPNALLNIIMHTSVNGPIVGVPRIFCIMLCLDGPFKMIRMLNYAINFMLYGLTGRQFRREFFRILRGKSRLPFDGRLLFRFTGPGTDRHVA